MEEFRENLKESIRKINIADHMAYLTYPLINDKRVLMKIFDEIFKSISLCIRGVLLYEGKSKEINVYKDEETNLRNFIANFSIFYELSEKQVKLVEEIYEVNKMHGESAMEFVRRERIVILGDDLATRALDIRKIKEYLVFAKEFLRNVNEKLEYKKTL